MVFLKTVTWIHFQRFHNYGPSIKSPVEYALQKQASRVPCNKTQDPSVDDSIWTTL